jgi:two-component system, OmpR family, sensor histidine kinase VicK
VANQTQKQKKDSILETTEVLYGIENAMNTLTKVMSRVINRADVCGDSLSPSFSMGVESIKKGYIDFKKRGVKIRFITEITKDNIHYCKELMKFVEELRHMDGVKGNMAVSEIDYVATAVLQEAKPVTQAIYSNAKAIIEQHRYFFENLWSKAIPAEYRIREIEEGITPIRTSIIKNEDEIIKEIRNMNNRGDKLSICSGFGGMQMSYNYFFDSYKRIVDKYRAGKEKDDDGNGGGLRWIINIDKDNLSLIKIFLEYGIQVRHTKSMPPLSFGVSDKEVALTIEKMEGGNISQSFLISNEPLYVNHFNSLFEELWKNGIDAIDRIKDIEQGLESANIEIIQNSKESIKRVYQLISSAKEEVLVMLSTANNFRRQVRMGGIQILKKAVEEHNINAKMLVPFDKEIGQPIKGEELLSLFYGRQPNQLQQQLAARQIDIRTIDKALETRITIVIIDKKEAMIWELKDDTKDNSNDAVGLAIYSNSRSIVLSYLAIFENLWKQSGLYKQLEMHDKMQREFINVAAHELRSPIQPILGLSDALLSKKGDIEQYRQLIDVINKSAKRLKTLTEDILDVTRIESQLLQFRIEQFNLIDVILNAIADCESQVKKGNDIKIELTSKSKDVFVKTDRARIYQVIMNLLGNAIKFIQKDGIINITVKKEEQYNGNNNNQILVKVKDTGTGIDPEIFPRLFSKFATKSQTGGTGLGLFISKSIIEALDGRIWAENNRDDIGATFYFSLPLSI